MIGIFSLSIGIGVLDNIVGLFLTLSAGLSWGIGTMIVKYGGFKSDGVLVAGWQQLIGVLPLIPFALYFDLNNFGNPNYIHYLIIFYAIFFSSAYTYWAYFTVLQKFSVNISDEYTDSPGVPVDAEVVSIPLTESYNANTRGVSKA